MKFLYVGALKDDYRKRWCDQFIYLESIFNEVVNKICSSYSEFTGTHKYETHAKCIITIKSQRLN